MTTSRYRLCVFNPDDKEVYGMAFEIVDEPSKADCHVLDGQEWLLRFLLESRDLLKAVDPSFLPPPVVVASGDPNVLALAAEKKLPTITKPFRLDELVDLVDAVVNWSDEYRERTFTGEKEH